MMSGSYPDDYDDDFKGAFGTISGVIRYDRKVSMSHFCTLSTLQTGGMIGGSYDDDEGDDDCAGGR